MPHLQSELNQAERFLTTITEKNFFIPTSPFGIIIPVFRENFELLTCISKNYSKNLNSYCATIRPSQQRNEKYLFSVSPNVANLFLQRMQMFAVSIIEIYENKDKVTLNN